MKVFITTSSAESNDQRNVLNVSTSFASQVIYLEDCGFHKIAHGENHRGKWWRFCKQGNICHIVERELL